MDPWPGNFHMLWEAALEKEKRRKKKIIITLNVNGLNEPIKRHRVADWMKKKNLLSAVYKNLP